MILTLTRLAPRGRLLAESSSLPSAPVATMFRVLQNLVYLGLLGFMVTSQHAQAPTPPETHVLREYKSGLKQVDPQLDLWLQRIYEGKTPSLANDADFQKETKNLDLTARMIFQLKRGGTGAKEVGREVIRKLKLNQDKLIDDVMLPYLLQAMIEAPQVDADDRAQARVLLLEHGGQSCPRKRTYLQDLRLVERQSLKVDEARAYLTSFQEFRSLGFQEEGLRLLMNALTPEATTELRKDLLAAIQPFPRLVVAYPLLFEDGEARLQGAKASIFAAEKLGAAGKCEEAQTMLLKGVEEDSDAGELSLVEAVASKLETCWRPKGDKARLGFWQDIESPLRKRYGFLGESLAERRIGLIYWGRNEFIEARKIFSTLLLHAEKKFPAVHADTLFTYARVVENEGEFEEAIEKYRFYSELYPKTEESNQAASSLIILSSLLNRPDDALAFALELIEKEAQRAPDDRDVSNLPMALYWAGKIYFEKSDRRRAEFYWSRLAQEFYSTFYGALGHYALERMTHKHFMIPPMQAPTFNREKLFAEFSDSDRQILERSEKLLLVGMKDEASCEIKEMPSQERDTHRQLVKAIFHYASGDWLGAVRIYQNLPKSYRIGLPRGMERVLFPRTYGGFVDRYAAKLNIDPSYVNAIIRQESVFNPRAQSPVGARGLMQLMPGTARMEARTVKSQYASGEVLESIQGVVKDPAGLSDPEVNIALGVQHVHRLFQKYKNPVFVLTSYNANPRATERWIQNIDSNDMIVFIERIPYRETRSYVKLVMRNYFYYKRWYEGPEAPLPLFESLLPKGLAVRTGAVFQASALP